MSIMLLKVILFTCLGALQVAADLLTPIPFGPSEMIACGGFCNDEQYLVCGRGFEQPYFRSFPNHCYMDAANQCIKSKLLNAYDPYYLEAPDIHCNFHKGYNYFESLTCEQYTLIGIRQKENLIKQIFDILNSYESDDDITITLAKFQLRPNNEIKFLRQLKLFELLVYTDCPPCTEQTKYNYSECSKTEEGKFKKVLLEFDEEFEKLKQVPNRSSIDFANNLTNLIENMLNKLLLVRGIKEHYNKKLESFYKEYLETIKKSENYIITNDIYSVGKTIADSFKMAIGKLNPNPKCSIVSELKRLSDETVKIITPFSTNKYPQPSLDKFTKMYGGVTEDKGLTELARSYDVIFQTAEQAYFYLSRMNESSLALYRIRDVLSSVDNFLGNASTCLGSGLTDEDGDIYDVLLCLSEANCNSTNINTLRYNALKCYDDYNMKVYCLNAISKLSELKRYNELALCISLALKSSNKEDINCCFK